MPGEDAIVLRHFKALNVLLHGKQVGKVSHKAFSQLPIHQVPPATAATIFINFHSAGI